MAGWRRGSLADENEWGPKVAAGLMALAVRLGVVRFVPNAIPSITNGLAAPTFSGVVTCVVDGEPIRLLPDTLESPDHLFDLPVPSRGGFAEEVDKLADRPV